MTEKPNIEIDQLGRVYAPRDLVDVFLEIYNRREIAPLVNPRRRERQKTPTIRLYHFTHPGVVAAIRKDGLDRGDVPVRDTATPSEECFNNAVWLTEQADPTQNRWAGGTPKTQVRMTVELNASDLNLWRWRDLARHLGVKPEWYQKLNERGGGFADKWFVYCNEPIPSSAIRRIEFLKGNRRGLDKE